LVAATRSSIELKRAFRGETQREILLALPLVTIGFPDMGIGFRRNSDTWQAFQRHKCKKTSISSQKCKKNDIFWTHGNAARHANQRQAPFAASGSRSNRRGRSPAGKRPFANSNVSEKKAKVGLLRLGSRSSPSNSVNSVLTIVNRSGQHPQLLLKTSANDKIGPY